MPYKPTQNRQIYANPKDYKISIFCSVDTSLSTSFTRSMWEAIIAPVRLAIPFKIEKLVPIEITRSKMVGVSSLGNKFTQDEREYIISLIHNYTAAEDNPVGPLTLAFARRSIVPALEAGEISIFQNLKIKKAVALISKVDMSAVLVLYPDVFATLCSYAPLGAYTDRKPTTPEIIEVPEDVARAWGQRIKDAGTAVKDVFLSTIRINTRLDFISLATAGGFYIWWT